MKVDYQGFGKENFKGLVKMGLVRCKPKYKYSYYVSPHHCEAICPNKNCRRFKMNMDMQDNDNNYRCSECDTFMEWEIHKEATCVKCGVRSFEHQKKKQVWFSSRNGSQNQNHLSIRHKTWRWECYELFKMEYLRTEELHVTINHHIRDENFSLYECNGIIIPIYNIWG